MKQTMIWRWVVVSFVIFVIVAMVAMPFLPAIQTTVAP